MPGLAIYPIPGFTDPVSSSFSSSRCGRIRLLDAVSPLARRGNVGRLIFLGVFAFSTVLLLSMSGVYHLLTNDTAGRAVLQRLDHGAIFILIAGTFTPLHGILFRGVDRWLPLVLIWLAAIAGVTLKSIFFENVSEWLGLGLYLGMGWAGALSGFVLWRRHGAAFIRPMVEGGLGVHGRWGAGVSEVAGLDPRSRRPARAVPRRRPGRGRTALEVRVLVRFRDRAAAAVKALNFFICRAFSACSLTATPAGRIITEHLRTVTIQVNHALV